MSESESHKFKSLWIVLAAGSVWGITEASVGLVLRGLCAHYLSGSVLTGTSMFFLALVFAYSQRTIFVMLMPLIASLYKLYTALILAKPILSGGIINPIYAYITEALALLIVLSVFNPTLRQKHWGQAIIGGFSALLAVNLFPAVGYFTGISACVLPGTQFPLSLWGAPVAISLAMITVPLGYLVANVLVQFSKRLLRREHYLWAYTSAMIMFCLWIVFMIHR
ncbi:MAG: hypothetical protein N2246_08750 [Candidatus Sumerlaeia bacterium]|nr:hypothetical protein [Candidatus Sumerlaeia bacterium]